MRYTKIIKEFEIIDAIQTRAHNGSYVELIFGIHTKKVDGSVVHEYTICDRFAKSGEHFHGLETFNYAEAWKKWLIVRRKAEKKKYIF